MALLKKELRVSALVDATDWSRDQVEKITGHVGMSGIFRFSPQDHNGLNKEEAFVMVKIVNGDWQVVQ